MRPRTEANPPTLPKHLEFGSPEDNADEGRIRDERRQWCKDNGVSFLKLLQDHYAARRAEDRRRYEESQR